MENLHPDSKPRTKVFAFFSPSFPTQSLETLIILTLKSILSPSIIFHPLMPVAQFFLHILLTYANNFPTFPQLPLYNCHPHNSLNNLIKSVLDDPFSCLNLQWFPFIQKEIPCALLWFTIPFITCPSLVSLLATLTLL